MKYVGYVLLVVSLCSEHLVAQEYEVPSRSRLGGEPVIVEHIVRDSRNVGQAVKLSVKDSTILYVLTEIARQANLKLLVDEGSPDLAKRISIDLSTAAPIAAIDKVLANTGLTTSLASDGTVLVRKRTQDSKTSAQEKQGRLLGQVIDSATRKPIAGATVEIQGTTKRVLTSDKGAFVITAIPVGSHVVHVRYIGYHSVAKPITIEEGKQVALTVVLSASASVLSGVVTTATGTQRKVEVGNDVTTINVEKIMQTNPVSSVTDLLATRVPGLVVGRVSGEPGAKTEIRLRGTNSIRASNEPIVIVDGVQVISQRIGTDTTRFGTSPIDQIDPNSIATIEVLKGPSAVALYGSNASNGVIIITTKRGQDGPARWSASAKLAQETMPGKWPMNYFAWGEDLTAGKGTVQCSRFALGTDLRPNWGVFPNCRYDSTTVYQVLNDPSTTVFGKGITKEVSTTVSGGSRQFTYSFTGGFASTLGLLKVPDADVQLLEKAGVDLSFQQRRPQALERISASGAIGVNLGETSTIQYTTGVTRENKRSTPLIRILNRAESLNPPLPLYDQDGNVIGVGSGVLTKVPNFMGVRNLDELKFRNAARYQTTVWNQITFEANGGLDVASGRETWLLKTGDYCPLSGPVTVAFGNCTTTSDYDYESRRTSSIATDFHVVVSGAPQGHSWLNVKPVVGLNMNGLTSGQTGVAATGLPIGGRGTRGAEKIEPLADYTGARRTVGMFGQATVGIADRIWLPFSVRTDAGNAIGRDSKPIFPRQALSYLVSNEPKFRQVPMLGRLPELRVRAAFGMAGQQPGLADKYRTFNFARYPVDNIDVAIAQLYSVGNTKLSPEISREFELGFDATVLETQSGRLAGTFTVVRKHTSDLLAFERLPPSLGGAAAGGTAGNGAQQRVANIGDAVFNSIEISIEAYQRFGVFDWTTTNGFSRQSGKLTRLNGIYDQAWSGTEQNGKNDPLSRYRVGYPINSVWVYPVLGYVDVDGNGLIDLTEVLYDDSLRYAGTPSPRFTLTSSNQFTMASRLILSAVLSYEDGGGTTTSNARANENGWILNDPTASMEDQVRLLYDASSSTYRVSTLRFQSLQLTYTIPTRFSTRYLKTRSIQVAMFGTNLGLWSTFSGKDPNIGGVNRDISTSQSSLLPIPRTYGMSVRIQ